jgi:hypothetical protein
MRGCLLAVCVLSLFVLVTPRNAAACDLCKLAGFVCSADNCEEVITCQPQSFGHNSYADCTEDWTGCYNGTEFCMWASLAAPVCKEPALIADEKAS